MSRVTILRGAARVLASITGMLLIYEVTFALEGMTTRIPMADARELATACLWTAPWMLLFCSGVEDFSIISHKEFLVWLGGFAALLFLYYFDRYTSMSILTKTVMPPLAVGIGLVPHFVRRARFLFSLASLAVGVVAGYLLYLSADSILLPSTGFAHNFPSLMVTFGCAGITTGLLVLFDVYRRLRHRFYANC
jgi:fructose-specific phosphotransferase system IIC component